MKKTGEILEQIQQIASGMQAKVGDAIRNSPAQEIEKNVKAEYQWGYSQVHGRGRTSGTKRTSGTRKC